MIFCVFTKIRILFSNDVRINKHDRVRSDYSVPLCKMVGDIIKAYGQSISCNYVLVDKQNEKMRHFKKLRYVMVLIHDGVRSKTWYSSV